MARRRILGFGRPPGFGASKAVHASRYGVKARWAARGLAQAQKAITEGACLTAAFDLQSVLLDLGAAEAHCAELPPRQLAACNRRLNRIFNAYSKQRDRYDARCVKR